MHDIFLSYSREDQAVARRFTDGLQGEGFSVWWDQALNPGEAFDQITEKALESAAAVVVLWSKKSVESRWVRAEATQAHASRRLVPVMIEACKRPILFELTQTADLSGWKGNRDDPAWQSFVAGLRRFMGAAAPVQVTTDAAMAATKVPATRSSSTARVIAVAAAALLLLGGGYWLFAKRGHEAMSGLSPSAAATRAASSPVTLAVMPFVNLSSDPEQEYFSDGLTEEILNQLSQVKDLRVTARTSSFAFKGKNEDLRGIGRQLGVARILEGSVRKAGQQLRITAQLIDVQSNAHLWSKTYERELKDVFAIQDEIAKEVTGALSVALDVGAMARTRGGTTNLDAYDQYLRAKALDRQHSGDQATAYYREAVRLDPAFISAWSALYYDLAGTLMFAPSAADVRGEMEQVGAHVLSLAPESWQAQSILAGQLADQHRWLEAEAALDKARAAGADFGLDVGGGSSVTHGGVDTLFLWNTGRIEEAVPIVQRRHEADPLSLQASDVWQTMLLLAHRIPDVEVEYQRSKPLEGDHRSIDSMEDTRRMMGGKVNPSVGRDAMQGVLRFLTRRQPGKIPPGRIDDKNALAIMRTVLADPAATAGATIYVALFAGYLGDKDLSLAAFQRTYVDLHGPDIFYLWFPFWDSFRSHPEFKRLVRDVGLVDYWRKSGKWSDFCKPVGTDDFECH